MLVVPCLTGSWTYGWPIYFGERAARSLRCCRRLGRTTHFSPTPRMWGGRSKALSGFQFGEIAREIEDHLDRLIRAFGVVVAIDVRFQLPTVAHDLLSPLLE